MVKADLNDLKIISSVASSYKGASSLILVARWLNKPPVFGTFRGSRLG
jgi:hypothetical protein